MTRNGETDETRPTERSIGMWGRSRVSQSAQFCLPWPSSSASAGTTRRSASWASRPRLCWCRPFVVARPRPCDSGSRGHLINGAIVVAAFVFLTPTALLFYGASMLLAGTRGYAGCEVFALSNWLWRRDDQIACAIFSPIDVIEGRADNC